ncbi:MAG: glycosyltransferase family 2 protein [Oscillospiraceae bacterium]|nr:glycosyltransferase family 2 protein [Oscillospiraceae bacterium]
MKNSSLYIVIPCYNEQEVLPITAPMFLTKLESLMAQGLCSEDSRVLFVNDGSKDGTWQVISDLAKQNDRFKGINLSRNRGHQNALLAGLMHAKELCDVTISIDCDGQDDINAMDKMLEEYHGGCDVVYGVRSKRETDTFFKRVTAEGFYKFMDIMGAETVFNHADYRLMSKRALEGLAQFRESNLFLRGMVPMVGFKSTSVYYERNERIAGESHYPLKKMVQLALNGITSLSTKPLHYISLLGIAMAFISFLILIYAIVSHFTGNAVAGWASMVGAISLVGGIQLFCLGVIGEYIGKIYTEVKDRPKYIIESTTDDKKEE